MRCLFLAVAAASLLTSPAIARAPGSQAQSDSPSAGVGTGPVAGGPVAGGAAASGAAAGGAGLSSALLALGGLVALGTVAIVASNDDDDSRPVSP